MVRIRERMYERPKEQALSRQCTGSSSGRRSVLSQLKTVTDCADAMQMPLNGSIPNPQLESSNCGQLYRFRCVDFQ